MEAPDKIYVEVRHPISEDFTELIGFEFRSSDSEIEYIRKDVVDETIQTAEDHAYFAGKEKLREELLGWAKEQEKKLESGSFTSLGKRKMLERIIEKIESL